MSYCGCCGRKEKEDQCRCIRCNPVTVYEALSVMIVFIAVPFYTLGFLSDGDVFGVHVLLIGASVLSGLLAFLTLLDVALGRSYLGLLFGCHQRVNRSLAFKKRPFVLCARCTGIMLGVFLTAIVSYVWVGPFWLYLIIGLPMIIDGTLQARNIVYSTNLRRVVTGVLFGFTFSFIFAYYNALLVYGIEAILRYFN